jgi:hypothetical protein
MAERRRHTRYLTMLVQQKGSHAWDVAVEDAPISCADKRAFWEQLSVWTMARVGAYPPAGWNCQTIVADKPGAWQLFDPGRITNDPTGVSGGSGLLRTHDANPGGGALR